MFFNSTLQCQRVKWYILQDSQMSTGLAGISWELRSLQTLKFLAEKPCTVYIILDVAWPPLSLYGPGFEILYKRRVKSSWNITQNCWASWWKYGNSTYLWALLVLRQLTSIFKSCIIIWYKNFPIANRVEGTQGWWPIFKVTLSLHSSCASSCHWVLGFERTSLWGTSSNSKWEAA